MTRTNVNTRGRSGLPFTVDAYGDISGTGENTDRPDLISNPYAGVSHSVQDHQPVQWINPAAFVDPAQGSIGSVGRNTLRAPGYGDVDLAFLKNIPIKERLHAQLRIELFNVFNRAQYGAPNASLSASNFGVITSTISPYATGRGTPREFQLSAKMSF